MNITNLFNGWNGVLKIVQSGTSSSGYNLSMINSTKVINGGSGIISLTRTSGAIDIIGFSYDDIGLFAAIGNNFT